MARTTGKDDPDRGVMANLPSTRPNRLSRHARVEADRPEAAKPAAAKARPAAKTGARAQSTRPKAVTAGARDLGRPARKSSAGRATAQPPAGGEQSGADLAATVVKAAGELAQIGATVAGQIIKRAAGRLPKP